MYSLVPSSSILVFKPAIFLVFLVAFWTTVKLKLSINFWPMIVAKIVEVATIWCWLVDYQKSDSRASLDLVYKYWLLMSYWGTLFKITADHGLPYFPITWRAWLQKKIQRYNSSPPYVTAKWPPQQIPPLNFIGCHNVYQQKQRIGQWACLKEPLLCSLTLCSTKVY